jgi:hypothetical protein
MNLPSALRGVSGRLAVVVATGATGAIIAFELFRPRDLSYDGLWAARTSIIAAVLLGANLLVLWWYAHRTEEQARTSRELFTVARGQFDFTIAQARAAELRDAEQRKPRVIADWRFFAPQAYGTPSGWFYVARNVDPGRAFNVVLILSSGSGATPFELGTMDPGHENRLPQDVINAFNQRAGEIAIIVSTTAVGDLWVVTENRVAANNRITHRFAEYVPTSDERQAASRGALGDHFGIEWVRLGYAQKFQGLFQS